MTKPKPISGGPLVIDGRKYPPFTIVYNEELISLEIKDMPDRNLRVWLLLNMHCNKTAGSESPRAWFVSWARLVTLSGRSRATVGRALQELEEQNIITRRRRQGVNVITLHKPPSLTIAKHLDESRSEMCDVQSMVQDYTLEVSAGETQTSSQRTSSYDCKSGPEKKRKGRTEEAQAFDDEHLGLVIDCWKECLRIHQRRQPEIMLELHELYRKQPTHFVNQMSELVQNEQNLIQRFMVMPGFEQMMWGE